MSPDEDHPMSDVSAGDNRRQSARRAAHGSRPRDNPVRSLRGASLDARDRVQRSPVRSRARSLSREPGARVRSRSVSTARERDGAHGRDHTSTRDRDHKRARYRDGPHWVHVVGHGPMHSREAGCRTCDTMRAHCARHDEDREYRAAAREYSAEIAEAAAQGTRDLLRERDGLHDRIATLDRELQATLRRLDRANGAVISTRGELDNVRTQLRDARQLNELLNSRLAGIAPAYATPPIIAPATPLPGNVAGGGGTGAAPNFRAVSGSTDPTTPSDTARVDRSREMLQALTLPNGRYRLPATMDDAHLVHRVAHVEGNTFAYELWGLTLQLAQRMVANRTQTAVHDWITRNVKKRPAWMPARRGSQRVLPHLDPATWAGPLGTLNAGLEQMLAQDANPANANAAAPMDVDATLTTPAVAPDTAMNTEPDAAGDPSAIAPGPSAPPTVTPLATPSGRSESAPRTEPAVDSSVPIGAPSPIAAHPDVAPAWQELLAGDRARVIPGIERRDDGRAANEAALRGFLSVARAGPPGGGPALLQFMEAAANLILSGTAIGLPRGRADVASYYGHVNAALVRLHLAPYEVVDPSDSEFAADVDAWVQSVRDMAANASGPSALP